MARMQRISHNHLTQGVTENCPACALIREYVDTPYAMRVLRNASYSNEYVAVLLGEIPTPERNTNA